MMGLIKNTGIFQYVAIKLAKLAKGNPIKILLLLFFATGIFSAFLDNVTTIIIMTPISILIAVELGISPIPFVISQIMASNIGGTATLIGDPPNLMIGSAANLSFLDFLRNLTIVVLINLIITAVTLWFFFRKRLHVSNSRKAVIMEFNEKEAIKNIPDLIIGIATICFFLLMFFFQEHIHILPATISLVCAGILLIKARHIDIEDFLAKEIEWSTILFFIGLFIILFI